MSPASRPIRAAGCSGKPWWPANSKSKFRRAAVVLELGAGYGYFINAVKARRRLAVDIGRA